MKIEIDLTEQMENEQIEEMSALNVVRLISENDDLFSWGEKAGDLSFYPHLYCSILNDDKKASFSIERVIDDLISATDGSCDGDFQQMKDWENFFNRMQVKIKAHKNLVESRYGKNKPLY